MIRLRPGVGLSAAQLPLLLQSASTRAHSASQLEVTTVTLLAALLQMEDAES